MKHAYCLGYGAYYDGYSIYCMDGLFPEADVAEFRRGFVRARIEARGV